MEINSTNCPCGTGKDFDRCCGRFHSGKAYAATPEELMRARYSAFYFKNVDYYLATTHPRTRVLTDRDTFNSHCEKVEWKGLQVKSASAVANGQGKVLFAAWYVENGKLGCIHEHSNFFFGKGRWYYVNGKQLPQPAVGRNEVCGSGKKFKRCCGR